MTNDIFSRRQALGMYAAVFVASVAGCGSRSDNPMKVRESNEARIKKALVSLLERRANDAFVILEISESKKFVQFAGSSSEGLLLDLPRQTLDDTERRRAKTFFLELGVEEQVYDVLDRPGGTVAGRQQSFQKDFGTDVGSATRVAVQVFERVYGMPADFDLNIITEAD